MKAELLIDNKKIEIEDNIQFPYTQSLNDLQNLSNIKTDFSKTITIPRTQNNDIVFGHLFKIDKLIITGDEVMGYNFNPYSRPEYTIYYNNDVISTGTIKLNNVTKNGYEINLFSNVALLLNRLKKIKLGNLYYDSTSGNKYLLDEDEIQTIEDEGNNQYLRNNELFKIPFPLHINDINNMMKEHNLDGNEPKDVIKPNYSWKGDEEGFKKDSYIKGGYQVEKIGGEIYNKDTNQWSLEHLDFSIFYNKLLKLICENVEVNGKKIKLNSNLFFNKNNPYYSDLLLGIGNRYEKTKTLNRYETLFNFESTIDNRQLGNVEEKISEDLYYKWGKPLFFTQNNNQFYTEGSDDDNYPADRIRIKLADSFSQFTAKFELPIYNNYKLIDDDNYGKLFDIQTTDEGEVVKEGFNSGLHIRTKYIRTGISTTSQNVKSVYRTGYVRMFFLKNNPKLQPNLSVYKNSSAPYMPFLTYPLNKFSYSAYYKCTIVPNPTKNSTSYGDESIVLIDDKAYNLNVEMPLPSTGENDAYRFYLCLGATGEEIEYEATDNYIMLYDDEQKLIGYSEPKAWGYRTESQSITPLSYGLQAKMTIDIESLTLNNFTKKLNKFSLFDILVEYSKMFNLYIIQDRDGNVELTTMNDIWRNYNYVDWTNKIDKNNIELSFNNNVKHIIFQTNKDDTSYAEDYKERFNLDYGSRRIVVNSEATDIKNVVESKLTIPIITNNSKRFSEYESRTQEVNLLNMEKVDGEKIKSSKTELPIYFPRYIKHNENINKELTDTNYINQDYYWSNNYSTLSLPFESSNISQGLRAGYATPSINYGTTGAILPSKDIYQTCWERFIKEIYNENTKIIKTKINLTPLEYSKVKFNTIITIGSNRFRLNSIKDYNLLGGGECEVELISILDINNLVNCFETDKLKSNTFLLSGHDIDGFEFEQIFDNWDDVYNYLNLTGLTNKLKLETINVTDDKLPTSFANLFNGQYQVTHIDLSGFDMSKITDMESCFENCESVVEIKLNEMNNVNNNDYCFNGCRGLSGLDLSMVNYVNSNSNIEMFSGCESLINGKCFGKNEASINLLNKRKVTKLKKGVSFILK